MYAYDANVGRVCGLFDAHDDAVSCVCMVPEAGSGGGGGSGQRPVGQPGSSSSGAFLTASWDCSVKLWT